MQNPTDADADRALLKYIYLFIWLRWVLIMASSIFVATRQLLAVGCGI